VGVEWVEGVGGGSGWRERVEEWVKEWEWVERVDGGSGSG